ncbi:hypothetical protein E4U54_003575 [Claviceps lovelessii]|nr:hypothetical protein E4U54_003575 [Claviceps lovelessii]
MDTNTNRDTVEFPARDQKSATLVVQELADIHKVAEQATTSQSRVRRGGGVRSGGLTAGRPSNCKHKGSAAADT